MSGQPIEDSSWNLTDSDDFEEISSEEVDRVLVALEDLGGTVASENIRYFLAMASQEIYSLVYGEDAGESPASKAA